MKLFISLLLAVLSVPLGLWLGVNHLVGAISTFSAQLAEVACALVGVTSFVFFMGAVVVMNIRRSQISKSDI